MPNVFNIHELGGFTGSEQRFRCWGNKRIVYTQGIQYLAKEAKCYWLIDEIALVIFPQLIKNYPDSFYQIKFVVNADETAMITVDDGNGNIHIKHKINWTDFPIQENPIKFYLCDSGDCYCLMLPSEY